MASTSRINSKLFIWYAGVSLAEGLLVMFWIASIPADPKNALVAGLSLRRLLLLGSTGFGLLAIAYLLIASMRNQRVEQLISGWMEKKAFGRLSSLIGMALALIILIPLADRGKWFALYERILPLMSWICLLALQWSALVLAAGGRFAARVKDWVLNRVEKSRWVILICMVFLIASYFLSTLLYPIGIKEVYWWETGVPILGWQIILSVVIGLTYYKIDNWIKGNLGRKTDITIFMLIFISCGLLWGFSRLNPSWFNPWPVPPNNTYYPYSDAAVFDLQAQSTLVGLGFNVGSPLDRPFYPMFLAIIHLISGQDYANNMMLQAFLFGLFPAIVYLICVELGSRSWGLMTASAISFLGANAIQASNLLDSSNPKQILTEFPLAIMLSLVLYLSIRWMKRGAHSGIYACIIGGMLAAAAFVRYSAVPLLPIWMIVAVIKHRPAYKKGLLEAVLIVVGFLVFTAPWYTRDVLAGRSFGIPFSGKVLFVIQSRYLPIEITTPPKIKTTQMSASPVAGDSGSVQPTASAPSIDQTDIVTQGEYIIARQNKPFLNWFTSHLVHNLMSSILILPTSVETASLKTSLDLGGEVWHPGWNGSLPPFRFIMLLSQFLILSAGFGALVRRDKTSAVIVILLFGGVQTANALGRTSGGRYIVPVDWLVLLVYFAGLLYLMGKLDPNENIVSGNKPGRIDGWRQLVVTFAAILFIGALPVLYERLSIALFSRQENILTVEQLADLPGSNISNQDLIEIGQFIGKKPSRLIQGVTIYPKRQYLKDANNIPKTLRNIDQDTYLFFNLIKPGEYLTAYFSYQGEIDIQNLDQVYLIGCRNGMRIIVRDMVVIQPDQTRFLHSNIRIDSCNR